MSDANLLSTAKVEAVLRSTLKALADGKSQMYDLAENARQECDRLKVELEQLKVDVNHAIRTVEILEKQFQRARNQLYQISRDYEQHSEREHAAVYKEAESIRESLAVAQERERNLRRHRQGLELSLSRMEDIATKAERFVSQVGVALSFLEGNIIDVNGELESVNARYQVGQGILKGQEDERKRLAREMHDGPVQDMANLILKLDICERLYGAGKEREAVEEFGGLRPLIQGIIGDVRRIIYDLSPMTLEDLGLVHTVTRYVEENCDHHGVYGEVKVVGKETRLDSSIELALFRTIQEAVNNSLKHGRPTEIIVRIEFTRNRVSVGVFDNGVGFTLEDVQRRIQTGNHYGLIGMQDRMKLLNGSFKLHSAPGQGTRIVVSVPLNQQADGGI